MKLLLVTSLFFLVLTVAVRADDNQVINFSCDTNSMPTHIIRLEVTRSKDNKKCSAIAVDISGSSPVGLTSNSDFNCEVTELARNGLSREELLQLQLSKAVGIGPMQERFETLRLVLDTALSYGGGVGRTSIGITNPLTCKIDEPNLQRYEFP